jgi:CBS domain-containing protein
MDNHTRVEIGSRRIVEGNGQLRVLAHLMVRDDRPDPHRHLPVQATRTPVSRAMQHDVFCVRDDVSEATLAELLLSRDLSGAPVVDADARLRGFVSIADLVRWWEDHGDTRDAAPPTITDELGELEGFHEEPIVRATVSEIMNPAPLAIADSSSIGDAIRCLVSSGAECAPVVSPAGRVVGMVTALDLLAWMLG